MNQLYPNVLGRKGGQEAESPSSAVCSTNSDILEPSASFRIEIGRNETEKTNLLRKYEDLQTWIWKECFNSSIVHARTYGKNKCSPLFRICDICLVTFDSKDICPSCHRTHGKVVDLMYGPPRIRLIKAILSSLEVAVPFEALHSSWTEDLRKTWGLELQRLTSIDDLLQILTQLEGAIKRDYVSEDFETTEELLCCVSSRGGASEFNYTGSVPQLPWIPKTAVAVALRFLELDVSIFYTPKQKAESLDVNRVEALPVESRWYER